MSDSKEVQFIYNKKEDYEPIYVNGVYGGVTPRGDLLCHFFYEYVDVPEKEILELDEKGQIKPDTLKKIQKNDDSDNVKTVKRDIRVGIIIPAHQIQSISAWMLDKLKASSITIEEKEK